MSKELPAAYTCSNCGKVNLFPGYVFAHWTDRLIHTCDCGTKHRIRQGVATLFRKAKPTPKP